MNIPNKITIFRILCIPFLIIASLVEFRFHWLVALIIYIVACVSDAIDGKYARKHKLVTDFGKLMDPLADKTLTYTVFLLFTPLGYLSQVAVIIMLAREFLVSGIRMVATSEGKVIAANMFGKVKTTIQMVSTVLIFVALFFCEFKGEISLDSAPQWLNIYATVAFWLSAIATMISGIKYTKDGWYLIKTK